MASRVRVRGVVTGSYVSWVRDTFGEPTFQRILERVSPATRERFKNGAFPTSWSPFDEWNELVEASSATIREQHGLAREDLERRSVREAGGRIIATFYKLVLPLVKPLGALRRMPLLHGRTFENSTCEVVAEGEREITLRFHGDRDFQPYFRRTSPLVVTYVAESAGAKNVAVALADAPIAVPEGAFAFDMHVRWV